MPQKMRAGGGVNATVHAPTHRRCKASVSKRFELPTSSTYRSESAGWLHLQVYNPKQSNVLVHYKRVQDIRCRILSLKAAAFE